MRLLILLAAIWTTMIAARADGHVPVFNENFDDAPPYRPKGEVPTGHGVIHFGEWGKAGSGNRPAYLNSIMSLSPPFSLAIQATESFEKDSRVLGFFGRTNKENALVFDGLLLKLAFQVSSPLDGLSFGIRNAEHKNAALVEMTSAGVLNASFSGLRKELASVEPGRWYYLEFLMPPDAGAKSTYTVTLYAEDGVSVLGTLSGELAQAAGVGPLAYFLVTHAIRNEVVYLDNVTAVENPQ